MRISRRLPQAKDEERKPPGTHARRFLYLDSSLTKALLDGLERGTYDLERTAVSEESSRELGGNVGVGALGATIGAKAGASTSVGVRRETDLEQTAESRLARLVEGLRNSGALKGPAALALTARGDLRPGDYVDAPMTMTIRNVGFLAEAVASVETFKRGAGGDEPHSAKEKALATWLAWLPAIYGVGSDLLHLELHPRLEARTSEPDSLLLVGQVDARKMRARLGELDRASVLAQVDSVGEEGAEVTPVAIYR